MMSATSAINATIAEPTMKGGREPVQLAPFVDHQLERADEDDGSSSPTASMRRCSIGVS
jgi:hypothetical protein